MSDVVDARGTRCPYPVIALARAAQQAGPRARLYLLSDDPVSVTDVPAWCRLTGAELLSTQQEGDGWRFEVLTGR